MGDVEELDFIKRVDFGEVRSRADIRRSLEKVDDAIRTLEFYLKLTEGQPPILTGIAALMMGIFLGKGSLWWTVAALALPLVTPGWARRYSPRASMEFLAFIIALDVMVFLNGVAEALYFLLAHVALLALLRTFGEADPKLLLIMPAVGGVPLLFSTFVPRYGFAILPFIALYPSLLSWESRRAVREELLSALRELLRSRAALKNGNLERYDPMPPQVVEREFLGFRILLVE